MVWKSSALAGSSSREELAFQAPPGQGVTYGPRGERVAFLQDTGHCGCLQVFRFVLENRGKPFTPNHGFAACAASQHRPRSAGADNSQEGQAVATPSSLPTDFSVKLGTHLGLQYKIRCPPLQASRRSKFCTAQVFFCVVKHGLTGELITYL